MKRTKNSLQNPSAGHWTNLLRMAKRISGGTLALMLGLTISAPPYTMATPLGATAKKLQATIAVYLYGANNTPVLAPDASVSEGSVFRDTVFLGIVQADNQIKNADGNIVGYVVANDPE